MLHAKKVASGLPPHIAAPLHVLRQPSFKHHADSHSVCLSGRKATGSPSASSQGEEADPVCSRAAAEVLQRAPSSGRPQCSAGAALGQERLKSG